MRAKPPQRSGLLDHIVFSKYRLHLPLTHLGTVYACASIELDVFLARSGLCISGDVDAIGRRLRAYGFAAEHIATHDTTSPGSTKTADYGVYVRIDRLLAGKSAPPTIYS